MTISNASANPYIVEWLADVTRDGKLDRIEINLSGIVSDTESKGDNVKIYSGKTGELIWSRKVSLEHVGQSGIYLYNDGKYDYIMIWEQYMNFGNAMYHYEIIKLTDTGETQVIKSGNFGFSFSNVLKDDRKNLKAFADEVNSYLSKSIALLDTNNFQTIFSTHLYKAVNTYNPSNDLKILGESGY